MSIRSLSYKIGPEIEWGGHSQYGHRLAVITVDGEEYLVGSLDAVEEAAKMSAKDSYEEGIFNQSFVLNYVDGEQFAEDQVDSDEYYDEEIENRPQDYIRDDPEGEDGEYSEEQKDAAVSSLKRGKKEDIRRDPFQYLHDMGYNDRDAMEQLSRYVDVDKLVTDAVAEDGAVHFISSYDGNQHDSDDLEINTQNFPEDLIDFLSADVVNRDDLCYFKVG